MLAAADRQRGLFDAAWCSELLAEDSIHLLLAQHGDRIVPDEDFAECYSERRGRPSIRPSLLAKVLLLAYREGLSDQRAMEAVRFDLRWKVALDLPIDHAGFHPTSLVRFRARLLLHGMERFVFERSLELASELGLLEGEAEQIVDSTPMLGAAAVQDTATLVRSGVRKLLDAVAAADAEAAAELAAGLRFDYSRPRVKAEGDWQDPDARMGLLAEVARDAERALRAVEEDDELAADAAIAAAAELLREIVGQEFEVQDDELPRPRRGRRTRQIVFGSAATATTHAVIATRDHEPSPQAPGSWMLPVRREQSSPSGRCKTRRLHACPGRLRDRSKVLLSVVEKKHS